MFYGEKASYSLMELNMQTGREGSFWDVTFSIIPEHLLCWIVHLRFCHLIHMLAKQISSCELNIIVPLF